MSLKTMHGRSGSYEVRVEHRSRGYAAYYRDASDKGAPWKRVYPVGMKDPEHWPTRESAWASMRQFCS